MISICSPQLGLSPESNSGGEVYDREVITRLCQKGVKVHTLLPKGRTYQQHDNLIVKYAPIRPMVPPHTFNAFVLPYLIKTYLTHRFDILRVHNPYFVGPAALAFKAIFPKVPVILSHLHTESGINGFIDALTLKKYDHIITISKSTKNELHSDYHYPNSRISVAYPGVSTDFKPRSKSRPKADQPLAEKITLLFLGGLKQRKNPQFLLKLLAKLNNKNLKLVFAGTGPLLTELKNLTNSLNLSDQVTFTGYINEKDKVKIYQSADILLLPSLKEGFGMTITEAAACGVPSIGANHYSIKEIIKDQKTGLLAKPNDLQDWTEKLLQLIKAPKLRQKMGQEARVHVLKTFSWDKNIETHIKLFNQLAKKVRPLRTDLFG
ncbi:glycosyltransferase family 4 protein [Patescibacteria group bacterium]|nr:glycosyltransferase family 4 protein [Patescibacteria group bacterium]